MCIQFTLLYTDPEGRRRLRVITRQIKLGVFASRLWAQKDDSLDLMNSEVSFMVLLAHTLQRYSEANILALIERNRDTLSKILHTFRESATKVYKQKDMIVPVGMQYLPYFLFCLEGSELFHQSSKGVAASGIHINSSEYLRREILRLDPQTFMLRIAPLVYNLRSFFSEAHELGESGRFNIPATVHPWEIEALDEGRQNHDIDIYLIDRGVEILILISPLCQYTNQVLKQLPESSNSSLLQPEFNTDEYVGWNTFHLVETLQNSRRSKTEVPVSAVYLGGANIEQLLSYHNFARLVQTADKPNRKDPQARLAQKVQAKFQEYLHDLHEKSLTSKITF